MRAVDSIVPQHAQPHFTAGEIAAGLFLPCVCRPVSDLVIAALDDEPGLATSVLRHEHVGDGVAILELLPSLPFLFRPGQFVHVLGPGNVPRPYSLASEPDGPLELHVRRIEGGAVSPWLADGVRRGDRVLVRGPFGRCHYGPGQPERALLLAGTGTGLAPLLGILRDALSGGHRGPIVLVHGARTSAGLYARSELERIADAHRNVRVHFSVLDDVGRVPGAALLDDVVVRLFAELTDPRVFTSGSASMVQRIEQRLRELAPAIEITSDPFLHAGS
jgi:CDP-4-dehydro-6-deoxyglucose reductase, E3